MTVLNERRVCEKLKGSNTALTVGLTFERSKITAVDYSAFTHIPTLSSLSLSFNLLTEVPESLCTLPLCDLDLSHNKLNGDIGEHCRRLAKLSALQNLHLKGNTALPAYYRLALAHSMPYLRKLDGKTLSRDRSTANLIAGEARATAESEWASVQATSTSKARAKKCWPSWIAAFRRDAKEGGKEAAFFNYWLGHWTKHLPDGKKVSQSHGNSQEKPSQKRVASPSATAAAGKRKRSGKAAAAAAVAAAAAAATAAVDGTKELLPAQGATSRQKMTKSPIKRKPISVGPRSEKRVAAVATSQSVVRRQKAAASRGRKACAATGSDPFGERRIKSIQPISFFRAHRFSEAGAETEPEVWACAAPPPDAEMANVVATAGGSSVSFLDCGIGRIIAKYTHEREIFYTISWTVLTLPEKIVLVAAAGLQGDIKIVDYGQKKCILQVGGHTKAINALEFVRKGDPSCIISGSDDGVVRLTKIVAQEVSEGATGLNFAAHALRSFDTRAPVMSLATGLEGWYLAGLSDGHVWAWSKNGKTNFIRKKSKLHTGTIDTLRITTENTLVSRASGENTLVVSRLGSSGTLSQVDSFPWPKINEYFVKVNLHPRNNDVVLGGDSKGNIYTRTMSSKGEVTKLLPSFPKLKRAVREIAFTASGTNCVAVYDGNMIGLFNMQLDAE